MYRTLIASAAVIVLTLWWTLDRTPRTQGGQYHRKAHKATNQKLEILLAQDALIRFKQAPKQYDEQGKPFTPSAAQLQELKGDPKLPGYQATFDALKAGQLVEVRLARPKKAQAMNVGDKPQWKTLATITARVAHSDRDRPGDVTGKGKAEADTKAGDKLIIEPNLATLLQSGLKVSQGPQHLTLGNDIYATRVMILADGQPDKQKGK
jgi:hypothetical protein